MTKYRIMNNQYRISNRKESQVHCSETLREIKVKGERRKVKVRGSQFGVRLSNLLVNSLWALWPLWETKLIYN